MWLHWVAHMFLKMEELCLETESSNSWEYRGKSNRCSNLWSCIKSSLRSILGWKMSRRANTILYAENTTKYSIRKWEEILCYLRMKDHRWAPKIRISTLSFQSSNRSHTTKRTIVRVRQCRKEELMGEKSSLINSTLCCKSRTLPCHLQMTHSRCNSNNKLLWTLNRDTF